MKIGFLSFAHLHADSYAKAVQAMPDVEFAGIYDEDSERGQDRARRFGTTYYADYQELLEGDVDAVIVCSSNAKHGELTMAAAEARKHVLCEKPLAITVEDAFEMVQACEDAGVKLQTSFPVRYHPAVVRARQAVQAGEIGRVLAIQGTNHGQMPGGWFADKAKAGGGAVTDHTVHVVDLMRWFLDSEIREVYAEIDNTIYGQDIDDCGYLSMELENGVFATLDPSWSRPKSFPMWGDVTMEIIGTGGTLSLDVFSQANQLYSDQNMKMTYRGWGSDMDFGLVRDFCDAVIKNTPVKVSGWDGLRAVEVVSAAYLSAEEGSPVVISHVGMGVSG